MASHKPYDRHFFTINGSVLKSGGSLDLARGQFGIFNTDKVKRDGSQAIASFAGVPKNAKLELKLGKGDVIPGQTVNQKGFSSFPFTLNDVVDIRVKTPKETELKVDEVVLGYNGIDNDTTLSFEKGEVHKLMLRLSGDAIGMLGYTGAYVNIPFNFEIDHCSPYGKICDGCDPCEDYPCTHTVEMMVEKIKKHPLKGGVTVGEFIEVTPILKCNEEPVTPDPLIPFNWYTLTVCDTGDLNALGLVQTQYPGWNIYRKDRKGAQSIYEVLLPLSEGAPANYETTIPAILKGCDACPAGYLENENGFLYVASLEDNGEDKSAELGEGFEKQGVNDNGVGFYTLISDTKLTDQEEQDIIDLNPTVTIHYVGTVRALCEPTAAPIETAWVLGDICNATTKEFMIDIPDNECGVPRLQDLQDFYPTLVIEAEGTTGGCQTRFKTTVVTSMVCPECDPIFEDLHRAKAPEDFEGRKWREVVEVDESEGCRCGIRLKGKPVEIYPGECIEEDIAYMSTSTRIEIAGGYVEEYRYGYTQFDKPYHVEYLSRAVDVSHVGASLKQWEDRSFVFFNGRSRATDNVEKALKGEQSTINQKEIYLDYVVEVRRKPNYSQGFSRQSDATINYHVMVELGRQKDVEDLLNSLATAAGVEPVKAY